MIIDQVFDEVEDTQVVILSVKFVMRKQQLFFLINNNCTRTNWFIYFLSLTGFVDA